MPVTALLMVLTGCQRPPEATLMWRESWELIALLDGTSVLDARMTVGNTGLLRGQGRLRFELWEPHMAPILFSKHDGPDAITFSAETGSATIGTDGFQQEGADWSLRLMDDSFNSLIQLSPPRGAPPPPAPATGDDWNIEAYVPFGTISGWISAGQNRGGLTSGRGVLIRRHGSAPSTPRRSAYILSDTLQLIADSQGDTALWWANLDGQPLQTAGSTFDYPVRGPITVQLPEATITIRRRRARGLTEPFSHLLSIESLLAAPLTGQPARRVQLARATATIHGQRISAPAVLVEVRTADAFSREPSQHEDPGS